MQSNSANFEEILDTPSVISTEQMMTLNDSNIYRPVLNLFGCF